MPELSNVTILAGLAPGFLLSMVVRRVWGRRLFVPLAFALGVGAASVLPFDPPAIARVWAQAELPALTGGAVYIGAWFAVLVLTFARRKGRTWGPFAAAVVAGVVAAYGMPPAGGPGDGQLSGCVARGGREPMHRRHDRAGAARRGT